MKEFESEIEVDYKWMSTWSADFMMERTWQERRPTCNRPVLISVGSYLYVWQTACGCALQTYDDLPFTFVRRRWHAERSWELTKLLTWFENFDFHPNSRCLARCLVSVLSRNFSIFSYNNKYDLLFWNQIYNTTARSFPPLENNVFPYQDLKVMSSIWISVIEM